MYMFVAGISLGLSAGAIMGIWIAGIFSDARLEGIAKL